MFRCLQYVPIFGRTIWAPTHTRGDNCGGSANAQSYNQTGPLKQKNPGKSGNPFKNMSREPVNRAEGEKREGDQRTDINPRVLSILEYIQ